MSETAWKENIPYDPQENTTADDIPEGPVYKFNQDLSIVPEVTCVYCNKIFASPHALEHHQDELHQGKKVYECAVCGKHFTHRSSRTIHMRVHTGQRPYECHVCKKRFRVTSHLRDHVRTHTGERPFKCVICGRGFKQSSDMKKHRKTHTKATADHLNPCDGVSHTVLKNGHVTTHARDGDLHDDVTTPAKTPSNGEPLTLVIKVERDTSDAGPVTPQETSEGLMSSPGKDSQMAVFPPSETMTSQEQFVPTALMNRDLVYTRDHWEQCGPTGDQSGSPSEELLPPPPHNPDYVPKSPEYPLVTDTTSYDVTSNDVTSNDVTKGMTRGDVIMANNSVTSSGFRHDDVMCDEVTTGDGPTEIVGKNEEGEKEMASANETMEIGESSVDKNKLQCEVCQALFDDHRGLIKHKCVRNATSFTCYTCAKVFARQTLLRQHMVLHQGNKRFKFKCNYCGRAFRHRSHLRDHERIHTGERPFQCTFCPKAFKQSSDLRKHENLHTGATRYRCEKCAVDFKRCDALKKHVATHADSEVALMKCGKCHSLFASADGNLSHTCQSKNYLRCQLCVKRFSTAEGLRQHCLVDHGSRPSNDTIKCEFCHLEMASLSDLEQHLAEHKLKKTHKCTICKEHFSLICQLENHMKQHSNAQSAREVNDEDDKERSKQGDIGEGEKEEAMVSQQQYAGDVPVNATPPLATRGEDATPYDKPPYDFIPTSFQSVIPVSAYDQMSVLHPITSDHTVDHDALRKLSESDRYEVEPIRKPTESSYYNNARRLSESDRYNADRMARGERMRYVPNPTAVREAHYGRLSEGVRYVGEPVRNLSENGYYGDARNSSESSDDVRDVSEEDAIVRKMSQSNRYDVMYRYDPWSRDTSARDRARSGEKQSSATIGYQMSARLKYTCLTCTHAYYNEQDLLDHVCDIKSETFYECSVCQIELPCYEELQEHMKTHWRTLVYLKCPSCGERFRNEECLRQHNLTHTRKATKHDPSPHIPRSPSNEQERYVSKGETVIKSLSGDTSPKTNPRGVSPSFKKQQELGLSSAQVSANPYMSYIASWKTAPTAFMNVFNANPPIMVSHAMYGRGMR